MVMRSLSLTAFLRFRFPLIIVYLAKLLDHLFDADVSILGDFALHVGEPLAELLVLFVEYSPLIQLLTHLLPAQRQLQRTAI